ncbi:Patched family protein [Haladaptatus sp. R4]|uniref:MMPL family transporter n=1 Tax=Haladaptatus sp. R4 TaxID=1679489 RepID=UPI0007B48920|nr:MMPL family transporter [Haladaptatus sp. R4]KZN23141.1 Patched family protein [Haladaptatus sp. R4]
MSFSDKLGDKIVKHSRLFIVALLVFSLLLGSGASMVGQSSSLDSFQSDSSSAAKAQSYISENFSTGSNNTTSAQIIVRDNNTLSKDSLKNQIKLQQALRNNSTVNETLTEDSPTVGIANILATTINQLDKAEELKSRGENLQERKENLTEWGKQLQARSEQLNESKEELQQRGEQLKEQGEELQARGEKLQQRSDELNQSKQELQQRGEELKEEGQELKQRGQKLQQRSDELNESRAQLQAKGQELQAQAKQLNESKAQLQNQGEELKQRAQELNESQAELEQRQANLEARAQELNQTQQELAARNKSLQEQRATIEEAHQNGTINDTEYEQRLGSLQEEQTELKADQAQLVNKSTELQQDRQELEKDAQQLKQQAAKLESDKAELEQQSEQLKETAEQMQAERAELEERSAKLQQEGKELQQAFSELQQDKKELQEKQAALETDSQQLKERGEQLKEDSQRLQEDSQELKEAQAELENDSAQLKEEGQQLQEQFENFKDAQEALKEDGQELKNDQQALQNGTNFTLSEQLSILESHNQSEIDNATTTILAENSSFGGASAGGDGAFAFMPTSYKAGSTDANATMIVVTQQTEGETTSSQTSSDRIMNSQLAMQTIAHEQFKAEQSSVLVFGSGIISDETQRSMSDSILIVGPLAVIFVLGVLIFAYRDLLDIILGLFGIGLVLVWTFGFMGWTGIDFNQIFIAVPVLLIGLSIDYAIHVFMRHREERDRTEGVEQSMKVTLSSLGIALILVTVTAVIGFLSNLVSDVPPIRQFGIVSSVGITAALIIFGVLIPALKTELDSFLEARGWDREKRAFGTGGGRLGAVLAGGATAARKAPRIVLAIAVILTVLGGAGAAQVDTSFSQEDFLASNPSGVMTELPEPFAPGEYTVKSSLEYVNNNFLRQDSNAEILIRGDITQPSTLETVEKAENGAAEKDSTVVLSSGEPDIDSPLSVMRSVANENDSFKTTFKNADTNGDGVPDRNLESVYDKLYTVAPDQAKSVLYRTDDGQYKAIHMTVSVKGSASGDAVSEQMKAVAETVEQESTLNAVATGQPIIFKIVQDQLLNSVIESLLITLGATFIFLMITYYFLHGSATLGFITMLPVAFSVSWILGTMYLLGISFNVITGLITSLTVGLGIAYSIHLSERYIHELDEQPSAWVAMRKSVTGTGGALLGSAATTVGGFGVLVFAILPPLQQFGIITGLTIIYSFLASVFVLPSLLALWTRYLGPGDAMTVESADKSTVDDVGATND